MVWGILILLLTVIPTEDAPPTFEGTDKLIHLGIFAIFSFLLSGALKNKFSWILIACISILFGVSMEVLQFAVPGRTPDIYDGLFNTLGAIAGALLFKRIANKVSH